MKDFNRFEKEIRQTYQLPHADPAFINRLEKECTNDQSIDKSGIHPFFHKAKGWVYATVTLLVVATLFFAIGPSKVLAQIQAVLGFVPGVGVVDTSTSFYQLAEPVSDSRDGITLSIQSAFLSADQTVISFTMTDLPDEIKRANFTDPACNMPAYLIFPDGRKVERSEYRSSIQPDGTYDHTIRFNDPKTANLSQATLVFPCLEGTALGKGPKDWHFDLAFEPAPGDIAVYPLTLMEQTEADETEAVTTEASAQSDVEDQATTMPAMIIDGDRQEEMTLLSVVEKADSYWVTWAYPNEHDRDIQVNGYFYLRPFNPVLYDANGTELPTPDHETQVQLREYEDSLREQLSDEDQLKYLGSMLTFAIPKSGVAFPVYAKLNVLERSFPEKEAYVEITFDGSLIQKANETLEINQEIQIGSVKFELKSIEKSDYDGYTFHFNGSESKVVECRVELPGYSLNMSGGRGVSFGPEDPFSFSQSVMFSSIPTGQLTARISQPAVLENLVSFIGSWSPDN